MRNLLIILSLFTCTTLKAQVNADSVALAELDQYFSTTDSASVFATLDSLFNSLQQPRKSRLMLKTGYVGQIESGSSTTLEQYGWAAGVSYYHKSGLFLDFNNYWNSVYDPNYYLTTANIGYINYYKILTYFASYQHYFKNDATNSTFNYTDELNGALFVSKPLLDVGLDYSALFGNKFTEHRINLSANGNFRIKNIGIIDVINFLPSITATFGNQDVTTYRLRRGIVDRTRIFIIKETKNPFGIMNYGFSCPVSIKINNFGLLLNYQYNLPQALPDERTPLENNSFFSASLSYLIEL
ncbi:MAG TPA: hypothetical protein PKL31_01530 [Fulvivirga sp.]|nr:hypothetical protein [Fulvivirga sp.]